MARIARPAGERPPGTLIHFFCVRPEHARSSDTTPDQLTIHERQWAFCPHDAHARDHEWQPTGGLTLSEIESSARGRGPEPRAPQERTEATG